MFRVFFSGLWYLHERKIVHGDMKVQNIVVSQDLSKVKLCDFGVSRIRDKILATTTVNVRATKVFCAPEIVANKTGQTFQTDIWSTACAVMEIYIQRDPWDEVGPNEDRHSMIAENMAANQEPHALGVLAASHLETCKKIEKCFAYDARKRPSAEELFKAWIE